MRFFCQWVIIWCIVSCMWISIMWPTYLYLYFVKFGYAIGWLSIFHPSILSYWVLRKNCFLRFKVQKMYKGSKVCMTRGIDNIVVLFRLLDVHNPFRSLQYITLVGKSWNVCYIYIYIIIHLVKEGGCQ